VIQSCGVVAATAILGYSFTASFRMNRIELWAPVASQGSAATVSVLWYSPTTNASELEVSDTSMSTAMPAHLVAAPPVRSLASFWQTDLTTPLAYLTVPVGGVIDVYLDLVLEDGATTIQPSPLVLVGAIPGSTYYEPLDGRGGVFVPISLSTN